MSVRSCCSSGGFGLGLGLGLGLEHLGLPPNSPKGTQARISGNGAPEGRIKGISDKGFTI